MCTDAEDYHDRAHQASERPRPARRPQLSFRVVHANARPDLDFLLEPSLFLLATVARPGHHGAGFDGIEVLS